MSTASATVDGGRAHLPAHRPGHRRRPGEDWTLVLLGIVTVLIVVAVGTLDSWSAGRRDSAVADSVATALRLSIGGPDQALEQQLITLQQDEVAVFQSRVDQGDASDARTGIAAQSGAASSQTAPVHNPQSDLGPVDSALSTAAAQHADSAQVQARIALISRELPVYLGLEATAQADNQHGFPVGAAYLREASRYFTDDILPAAEAVVGSDQARLASDDAAAGGFPLQPAVAGGVGLLVLVVTQITTARYSRRTLNPGLVAATAAVLAVSAWSVAAISVGGDRIARDARPSALAAVDLSQVRADAVRGHLDDQLTQADNGEDCQITTITGPNQAGPYVYDASCSFEDSVITALTPPPAPKQGAAKAAAEPPGNLVADLKTAVRQMPDRAIAQGLQGSGMKDAQTWLAGERALPTLENLDTQAKQAANSQQAPRYDPEFLQELPHAVAIRFTQQVQLSVDGPYQALVDSVDKATSVEWSGYDAGARRASGVQDGLRTGSLLLGLLAGLAVTVGVGRRVGEYWSRRRG